RRSLRRRLGATGQPILVLLRRRRHKRGRGRSSDPSLEFAPGIVLSLTAFHPDPNIDWGPCDFKFLLCWRGIAPLSCGSCFSRRRQPRSKPSLPHLLLLRL